MVWNQIARSFKKEYTAKYKKKQKLVKKDYDVHSSSTKLSRG